MSNARCTLRTPPGSPASGAATDPPKPGVARTSGPPYVNTVSTQRSIWTTRWTNKRIWWRDHPLIAINEAGCLIAGEWVTDGPAAERVGPYLGRPVSRARLAQEEDVAA